MIGRHFAFRIPHLALRTLDRYLLQEWLRVFLVTLLGFPILVIVIDLTDKLDTYLGRGIKPGVVALSSSAEWMRRIGRGEIRAIASSGRAVVTSVPTIAFTAAMPKSGSGTRSEPTVRKDSRESRRS